ncbi:30S ribosomal protein S17 [Candidatus Pacearchaeota archaeon]|nr:30S ribosomal protein S17 [Candidatus Pacearchaeota archaeon]
MEKNNKVKGKDGKVKNLVETMEKVQVYSLRGRKFEGYVIRKFDKRVTIEFERVKFVRKYERYLKTKTKLHARLPESLKNEINIGDYIQIMECRPLSKIIHFVAVKKIREADDKMKKKMQENKEKRK